MDDVERLEREAKERRDKWLATEGGHESALDCHNAEAALDEALAGWKEAERLLAIGDRAYGRVMDERDKARADVKKLRDFIIQHHAHRNLGGPRVLAETDREEYR